MPSAVTLTRRLRASTRPGRLWTGCLSVALEPACGRQGQPGWRRDAPIRAGRGRGSRSCPRRSLSAVQLLAEKREDRLVEVAVKGRPIEPRRVLADRGHARCEGFAAGGEEREMSGLDKICPRRRGQVRLDDVRVPPIEGYSVVFGLPELDPRGNRGETGGGKGGAGGESRHHRRLAALVIDPNRGRRVTARTKGRNLLMPPLAPPLVRMLAAEFGQAGKLRVAADRD